MGENKPTFSNDKTTILLNGKPVLFVGEATLTCSNEDDSHTKELDDVYVREKTWTPEMFSRTYTFEIDVEATPNFRRNVSRLAGTYRPNRGSSHPHQNKLHRIDRYLVKAGKMNGLKRKYTLADIELYNNNRLPF